MRRIAIVGLVAVALLAACGRNADAPALPSNARVKATATGLVLDRTPWWPTGFDAYQLATDWSVNVGCGAQVDLNAYFSAVPARSLTRFNLFAALAVDKKTGRADFRAVDAVFAAAARHRRMVLPVLTGGASPCEGDMFKDRSWYRSGWSSLPLGPHGTFADWVDTAVKRYRGEPSVAGWEPVGEPEPADCTAAGCTWSQRTCAADAPKVLRSFFDAVGGRIHRLDPGRLVFSGTTGGDQCGIAGDGYPLVARSPGVDVMDYHDYPDDASPTTPDTLAARIAQMRAVGKPIVVNEVGLRAGSCLSRDERARSLRARLADHRRAGAAGALLWAYVPDPRPDQCTFDIGPDDPLWKVVSDLAS
ncbi:hypothetical protein nbrc107696_43270 [Gordonia spumicola]|uniref:Beta-mannosidase n=1 Tax=Gordonia spumicola TaxID=589161 RepID=A0A7I9VFK5_9ACTN|nr:hypothetical protein nbrc107696_43270 [Gordonia spumicola]